MARGSRASATLMLAIALLGLVFYSCIASRLTSSDALNQTGSSPHQPAAQATGLTEELEDFNEWPWEDEDLPDPGVYGVNITGLAAPDVVLDCKFDRTFVTSREVQELRYKCDMRLLGGEDLCKSCFGAFGDLADNITAAAYVHNTDMRTRCLKEVVMFMMIGGFQGGPDSELFISFGMLAHVCLSKGDQDPIFKK